jgi:hypothetical protein
MGSQNSKEIKFRDDSLLSLDENLVDYNGIKTSEECLEEEQKNNDENNEEYSSIFNEKDTLEMNKIDSNKIPVTFEWESGGNSVYLSGNFCYWSQYFLMEKNKNGKFTLTLLLNKGIIQYKFKVDNEWKCNEKYPTIDDNGNKNNFIDTTNWEISAEKSEETTNANTELSLRQNDNKSFSQNFEFSNSQNIYCNYIPKKNEMNDLAVKIPEQYKYTKNIEKNTRQEKIGNKIYFSSEEKNLLGDNYSYKSIMSVMPDQINHLNYKNKDNKEESPIVCSIVFRHRLKFTTFVYYKKE